MTLATRYLLRISLDVDNSSCSECDWFQYAAGRRFDSGQSLQLHLSGSGHFRSSHAVLSQCHFVVPTITISAGEHMAQVPL